MGCEAYIDRDLTEDPWYQSCIDSYSDLTDEDSDNDYVTANQKEVWSLAYKESNLSIFLMPIWYFPAFDHFVALAVRWSFTDRYLYDSKSTEYNEEYSQLMLDW